MIEKKAAEMKTIGLIGGMSWQSTAQYYAALNRETARLRGGLHSAPILLHSLDFAAIEALQRDGSWDEAGAILARSAQVLETAGAHLIVLATNTMHICAPRIEASISVPFLHIADPTAEALKADGAERVGPLGTRFTVENGYYTQRLRDHGLDPLTPDVGMTTSTPSSMRNCARASSAMPPAPAMSRPSSGSRCAARRR